MTRDERCCAPSNEPRFPFFSNFHVEVERAPEGPSLPFYALPIFACFSVGGRWRFGESVYVKLCERTAAEILPIRDSARAEYRGEHVFGQDVLCFPVKARITITSHTIPVS